MGKNFYPRPLRGGRRRYRRRPTPAVNFYPRPLRGGRPQYGKPVPAGQRFLSTPSARRATSVSCHLCIVGVDFYPRPLRGGRLPGFQRCAHYPGISIHALCEEGDALLRLTSAVSPNFYPRPLRGGRRGNQRTRYINQGISIHALCEEGDVNSFGVATWLNIFLSTPSARRATAKTETKSLFSNKLYNILHEFRRALIYNGSKSYPNHAK